MDDCIIMGGGIIGLSLAVELHLTTARFGSWTVADTAYRLLGGLGDPAAPITRASVRSAGTR